MDRLLNLKEWELLVRSSYLIIFAYLWIRYGRRKKGAISVIATDNGLYFLISETSKLYSGLYFFISWGDIEHILLNKNNDELPSKIKTKIPLVTPAVPVINTKIPLLKNIYLRELPENYKYISLQSARFSQPEFFSKTIEIEPDITQINKWVDLSKKYPVKIIL